MRVYQEAAVSVSLKLDIMDCPTCGIVFGVSQEFIRRRRDDGQSFYCPSGHSMSYGTTELDKARQEATRAKHEADQAKAAAERARKDLRFERECHDLTTRRLSATKGVVTKMRKRVQAGVCPVPGCKRSFGPESAMARHLASEHPDWHPEEDGEQGKATA